MYIDKLVYMYMRRKSACSLCPHCVVVLGLSWLLLMLLMLLMLLVLLVVSLVLALLLHLLRRSNQLLNDFRRWIELLLTGRARRCHSRWCRLRLRALVQVQIVLKPIQTGNSIKQPKDKQIFKH